MGHILFSTKVKYHARANEDVSYANWFSVQQLLSPVIPRKLIFQKGVRSGLVHAREVLSSVEEISFTNFESRDVVRHPVVQSIVDAYDAFEGDN